jgi:hypothetical protein
MPRKEQETYARVDAVRDFLRAHPEWAGEVEILSNGAKIVMSEKAQSACKAYVLGKEGK